VRTTALALALALFGSRAWAADLDEFKVKREEVFEFAQKPVVTRSGDRVTISFESKGFCDATVAVEDAQGRIVRHLVSGVLGPKAPEPFQKNALKQAVVWDGKDDRGYYLDDKDSLSVRVSLGLQPQFERTLYWSPKKRYGSLPIPVAAPEGVYLGDGKGVDFIRLFDHEGGYVRAVYPFPSAKLKEIEGLDWHDFPQGYRLPRKGGLYQCTLLSSGTSWNSGNYGTAMVGTAATAMAVHDKRLALAFQYLNRLTTEGGGESGLKLRGPRTGLTVKSVADALDVDVGPSSAAFSPDGKTLYLTGYLWTSGSWMCKADCQHAVLALDFEKDAEPRVFAGDRAKHGSDETHFRVPTSVACDPQGRVYVADFLNDRVQVFEASGKLVGTVSTPKPTKVCVHQRTGEIWVFSYEVSGVPNDLAKQYLPSPSIPHTLSRFSALPEAKRLSAEPFPMGPTQTMGFEVTGHHFQVELDSWAKEPTVWVTGRKHHARTAEYGFYGGFGNFDADQSVWKAGVRLQRQVNGKWEPVRVFGDDAQKEVLQVPPPAHNIQHLTVSPLSGKLYLGEADSGPTIKACNSWLEIDPATGKMKVVRLPFNAMDGAFDLNGMVYLRNTDMIARYDFATWREVPWDYGEERRELGNDGSIHGHSTPAISGLKLPSTSPVCYHQGGLHVSARGNVVASCAYRFMGISRGDAARSMKGPEEYAYRPRLYPGRVSNSTSPCLHVWDQHGKLKYEDAVPGVGQCDGVALGRDDSIYVMHAPTRVHDGKPYFDHMSETLMKIRPGAGKVISSTDGAPIPLPKEDAPKRPPDLLSTRHGSAWAEGAEWQYGGVGFAGFNMHGAGGGCACWFARFALDYFDRSFAPEPYQFRVAVLDSGGNLILRIGQYGNVEDGRPLVAEGGPKATRSLGGDEVGLVHACFVGTHTDRRLFISDIGNARILSVKLGYHATETVALKDVPDSTRGKPPR